MKGNEMRLAEFMDGRKKRFIIPVYQRNYDWKIEHCKQLFEDLIAVVHERRSTHFFGAIVFTQQMNDHVIIDGQQRLTTVSLLLLAMSTMIQAGKICSENDTLSEEILEDYLIDKRADDETRIKLKPIKDDQLAFQRLFSLDDEHLLDSNLSVNYRFFCEQLARNIITPDELYSAINKLEIIAILLTADDNPQLIFESLNSTGLDLSEGDKIRNYVLMGLPASRQEKFYEAYWNRIEKYTRFDVSSFIRDYLSIKTQQTPTLRAIYTAFKEYMSKQGYTTENIEPLLADLRDYARLYEHLLLGNTGILPLDACIARLNRLESTVTRPHLMEVLRLYRQGDMSDTDVTSAFMTVESYLFRRLICDLPTNTLNKTFLLLHREVLHLDADAADYLEKLRYVLGSKRERQRFPDDREFEECLRTRNIYDMQSKNKKYLFERLENFGTAEVKDVWEHIERGTYTIEHIMPQHLTPAWMEALGDEHDMVHREWLHRLANLTLTAYNPNYSNHSFSEKRDAADGFSSSGLRMNQYISTCEKWTLTEMEQRNEMLVQRALKIWPQCASGYTPVERPMDMVTLDDEENLTGRKIERFAFRGAEQPVSSWIEMYMQVLRILHFEDRSVLSRLAAEREDSIELANMVTNEPGDSGPWSELTDGIYVWNRSSTQYKLTLLRRFFALFGADPLDLLLYISDSDSGISDEETARFSLRYRYWSLVIPRLRDAFTAMGGDVFTYVNPTKESWSSCGLGYGGIGLVCVGKMNELQVQLNIGSSNAARNKAIFDKLLTHKGAIEAIAGTLIWDRGDDLKSSKIFVINQQIGIEHETDWPVAVEWHVENCTRIYRAFAGLLEQYARIQ